jgi:hypothetical protein
MISALRFWFLKRIIDLFVPPGHYEKGYPGKITFDNGLKGG